VIGMATVQEISSPLPRARFGFQQVLQTNQARRGDGPKRALLARACGAAAKPGRAGGLLGVRRRPGCLTQAAPEPSPALARCPRSALAGPRLRPRTDPGPTGEVVSRRTLCPIHCARRDPVSRGDFFDPGERGAQGHRLRIVPELVLKLRFELGALRLQERPLLVPESSPPALVLCYAAF
jgi:hypothetical protein